MILYFSGTGNSRFVAESLSRIFGEECRPMVPAMRGSTLEIPSTDRHLIWVFPVYSWGVPPYVRSIMSNLKVASSEPLLMHAVMTCGDDCGRADRMWRRDANRRGWTTGSVCTVQMPNNYVAMKGFDVDPKELEAAKLAAAPARISEVVNLIEKSDDTASEITDVVSGSWAWIKTAVVYPWFVRNAMSPKRFHVTDACISCGKCARACPCSNITMVTPAPTLSSKSESSSAANTSSSAKRPTWGPDCAGCLGCYHICPTHAIAYGRSTLTKGQYYLPSSHR